MIATNHSPSELLELEKVRGMLRSPGPCITILLPPYHPGEPAGSRSALLKSNIQEAERQLLGRVLPPASPNFLERLERLAEDSELMSGSHWGRAIFCSPGVLEQFHLTQPVAASLTVGGSFAIRKVAWELARPRLFYILALTKEKVSLLRCAGLEAEAVSLPPGVPETLAEALALEPPDHDLENRSAAGSSTGAMRAVRFGTGSGRERRHAYLAGYYKLVERGLETLLREPEIPLILAGVEEDTGAFRAVSGYACLAKSNLAGSPDIIRLQQAGALQHAYSILRAGALERQAAALAAARERTTPARFSTDPDAILHAAFDGRVAQLWVSENGERIELFERGKYKSWGGEDLLNLAMVQTLIHHGKVCALTAGGMPRKAAAAAVMRF